MSAMVDVLVDLFVSLVAERRLDSSFMFKIDAIQLNNDASVLHLSARPVFKIVNIRSFDRQFLDPYLGEVNPRITLTQTCA
jgi:hypothetical protein